MQAVVPVPQRREQRRVADALHKKAGPGGPELRLVVVGTHVQVEAARLLSRVESERLLAEHLHKAQRIHPAQVGVAGDVVRMLNALYISRAIPRRLRSNIANKSVSLADVTSREEVHNFPCKTM